MARSRSSSRHPRHSSSSRGNPSIPPSSPRRSGFTPPGLNLFYQLALSSLNGAEQRASFNTMAR